MHQFCQRHYRWLAVVALALGAFNLSFRLDREVVTAWDEALYATSAAEMVQSGNVLVTTFDGRADAYNAKPPLNVWLIAASFRWFGISLFSLRVCSALSAFASLALMQWWIRRAFNPATALLTTIVLSTTFGYLYVHSARSGNPDALLALTVVASAFVVWLARERPLTLLWLGPLFGAAFMLKGTAVLMPVTIVAVALLANRCARRYWLAYATSTVIAGLAVAPWVVWRWRADGIPFFSTLVRYDFIDATRRPLEGHEGSVLFYLHQVQKDQYDWLVAGVAAFALLAVTRTLRRALSIDRWTQRLLLAWAGVALIVPTLMATKLPWYINPVFPVFAVAVAALIIAALEQLTRLGASVPRTVLIVVTCASFGVAESKLLWYSYAKRDLSTSLQGALLSQRDDVHGQVVISSEPWDLGDRFVLEHLIGGAATVVTSEAPQAPERSSWRVSHGPDGSTRLRVVDERREVQ